MNEVINTLLNHRSVRSFQDKKLSREQIETIVTAAQSASTSSYVQSYTIIGVTEPAKKARLAELAGGQTYVEKNGHFFVFCADLYRHDLAGEMEGLDITESIQSTELFMVSLIDTALVAQNAAIAAESMGLGICYIGGIRNNLREVSTLLNIPEYVVPLFGMSVGYSENIPDQKPRLPLNNVYHENEYEQNKEQLKEQLQQYNETISHYYGKRTEGKRTDGWTKLMATKLSKPNRTYMKDFLNEKGFSLK